MKELLKIIALCFLFGGCIPENCTIDYVDFANQAKSPFIHITNQKKKCIYGVDVDFWLDGKHISSGGDLFSYGNAFYLRIDSLGSSKRKFFDFSKKEQDEYTIVFGLPIERNFIQTVKVDEVYIRKDGTAVHIFRFKDAFSLSESNFDLVFLVSQANGIIGSYISNFHNGGESIISERGDILLHELNYSKKEFRTLE